MISALAADIRLMTEAKSSCGTTGEKLDLRFGGSWAWRAPIPRTGAARRRSIQRMRLRACIVPSSFDGVLQEKASTDPLGRVRRRVVGPAVRSGDRGGL